ncbi:hypothetical protein Tco_0948484 [Tanacetum coccineum]
MKLAGHHMQTMNWCRKLEEDMAIIFSDTMSSICSRCNTKITYRNPNSFMADACHREFWKQVDTPYRAMWDTAYWGFLGVRAMIDIFQNLLTFDLRYNILSLRGYGVLGLQSFVDICEV